MHLFTHIESSHLVPFHHVTDYSLGIGAFPYFSFALEIQFPMNSQHFCVWTHRWWWRKARWVIKLVRFHYHIMICHQPWHTKLFYWRFTHANKKKPGWWRDSELLIVCTLSSLGNTIALSPMQSHTKPVRGKNSLCNSNKAHSQLTGFVFRGFQHSRGYTIHRWAVS